MSSEHEYLAQYDASRYPSPIVTVDSVLFSLWQQQLCVLLVQRARHPQRGLWGLPGGFIDLLQDGSTRDTALRKLREKTGVNPPWLEQLATYSGPDRDPRGWSLTTAWYALIAAEACSAGSNDVSDARWQPVAGLAQRSDIAFDHQQIVADALQRLRQKTLYSLLPVYCLPAAFTLTQLQEVTETILARPVQRKSLIRRFDASEMFEETGESVATGARKAKLYRLKPGADIHHFSRNLMSEE
ncbi:NUDIX domain-containing protein [Erwinia sp. E602]|uniref:NUDIX hydrolase n=1 Tax=Erwinia sp. E602 TaxID=2675378 RepID=UPI001BA6A783|nr:NUDIX domain-containing protein [Erwinia sp. E602]QUG74037.1 NUDIX domain-containing protein [Erwinia sp. E602]